MHHILKPAFDATAVERLKKSGAIIFVFLSAVDRGPSTGVNFSPNFSLEEKHGDCYDPQ